MHGNNAKVNQYDRQPLNSWLLWYHGSQSGDPKGSRVRKKLVREKRSTWAVKNSVFLSLIPRLVGQMMAY